MDRMQKFHIPEVLDMLAEMHAESPHFSANHIADAEHVAKALTSLLFMPRGIAITHFDGRNLAGLMLGVVADTWYSPTLEACEMVLYVRPEYRGSPLAPRLIGRFEAEAIKLGAKVINAGTSAGVKDDAVIRLYERLGYTRTATGVRKIV